MRNVLITGGSEGIGFALAECFAKKGYALILNGRNEEKLKKAKEALEKYGVPVRLAVMDLSEQGSAQRLYAECAPMDVLVNNAGCGYAGVSWEGKEEAEEKMVVLNDASLMTLSRLFLKDHVKSRDGILLNVSSTGAFQPGPYIASYYASKSFVLSWTQAIACEAKRYGVHVHCLCPGPVHTYFYEKSGGRHPANAMTPEQVACYAFDRLGSRKVVLVPGFGNRILRLLPEQWKMYGVAFLKRRKTGTGK